MRLPIIDGNAGKINEAEAIKMIRYAIDHGVNYVDTAYVYHKRNSEIAVGKALQDGYREKIRLATKMPTTIVNSQQEMDKCLDEQLGKLQTDHIDFYLLHGLRKERWPKLQEMKVFDWAERKIKEGKIRYLGFSFHDELSLFKEIIDSYSGWTFCQIQYNYVDSDYQAGTEGLKYAASKGLAVVVMEPLVGGKLAIRPPNEIQALWEQSDVKVRPVELALRWVWNHPEVSVVLSGMSTLEQVKENVELAEKSDPGTLGERELDLVDRVAKKYKQLGFVGCTGCKYCLPCPQGVNIPEIFALYNQYFAEGRNDEVKKKYWESITPESDANRCVRCGKCEEICPQHLSIRTILRYAAQLFDRSR